MLQTDENPPLPDEKPGNFPLGGGDLCNSKFFTVVIQIAQGLGEDI